MGILRVILALVVLVNHFASIEKINTFISGGCAVRIFYLISGFYIQYIISQYDHQQHWRRNFYSSRLLRIFPGYYLILILTLWWNGTTCNIFCASMVINGSVSSLIYYFISNLLIIGQSVGRFMVYHFSTGTFSFEPDAYTSYYWVNNMQAVTQAWSLSLELLFYLCAPFILKRKTFDVIVIALVSFVIKMVAIHYHSEGISWYNSFFPAEFHTFLLGSLAARAAKDNLNQWNHRKYLIVSGLALMAVSVWNREAMLFSDLDELLILGVACFLPFIFLATKNSKIDRWIGDLSYPIYLNHMLVLSFLGQYITTPSSLLAGVITLSVAVGILTILLIEHPVDRFRHKAFRAAHAYVKTRPLVPDRVA